MRKRRAKEGATRTQLIGACRGALGVEKGCDAAAVSNSKVRCKSRHDRVGVRQRETSDSEIGRRRWWISRTPCNGGMVPNQWR